MPDLFTPDDAAWVHVAVERAVDRHPDGLTYALPRELADVGAGERVVVPLGRGNTPTPGYVVGRVDRPDLDLDAIKPVLRRARPALRLPGQLVALASWISAYYCAPIGMTLASMLPAAVKRGTGLRLETMIDLAPGGAGDAKLPPKQAAVVRALEELPADHRPIEIRELADRAGARTLGPVRRLVDAGVLVESKRSTVEAKWVRRASDHTAPEHLTPGQRTVVDDVGAALGRGFSAHLLCGVTGSGKTEVYIRLIRRVVDAGRTALVLVPEIALTPQTGGRLIGRFPDHRVAVLHSGLTAAQRHQQWSAVADGQAHIVLGARSAVFAPIPDGDLGLIVVDEEHDGSYKQDQVPRYHGRDVAVRRAQLAGVPILLGSATPALESWHNATVRRSYALHRLPERAPGLRLPKVHVLDFAEERRHHRDRRVHLMGPTLTRATGEALDAGGQVLILLNRRGYASWIACPDHRCGWVMQCPDCDVTVVYHRLAALPTGGYVQCHHCRREQRLPATCPDCGLKITTFGFGTQRVEEELLHLRGDLELGRSLVRVDSDSMRTAHDYHDALERFGAGEIRVLLGTQMIAKGLDYPGVHLVGVINADTAIHLPDFRASERTFQLVAQVAGRCGRSAHPGRVIVQTFHPDAPAIRFAARHDYETFAGRELEERRAAGLPPWTRMARIIHRHVRADGAEAAARRTEAGLRRLAGKDVRIEGAGPCPIARIAGRHRWQVEIVAPGPAPLQALLSAARNAGLVHAGTTTAIDVDPLALL